jgi:hypothetical protein
MVVKVPKEIGNRPPGRPPIFYLLLSVYYSSEKETHWRDLRRKYHAI